MLMLIIAAFVIGLACSTAEQRHEARERQKKYNMPVLFVTLSVLALLLGPSIMDAIFGPLK